jgi:hypothetical protein
MRCERCGSEVDHVFRVDRDPAGDILLGADCLRADPEVEIR